MNVDKLASVLAENEAFLISSPENRRYFTGFPSSDGFFLVTRREAALIVDGRYWEAAKTEAADVSQTVLARSFVSKISELVERLGIKTLYLEREKLSVAAFYRIKNAMPAETRAEKLDEVITSLRRKKSEEEKKKILAAQAIAEKAFERVLGFIKEGVTERETALELEIYMLRNGAERASFDVIVVSGENSSKPHGVPSDRRIERGDLVTLDFGAVADGYHSDATRTVAVGEISSEKAKAYETVLAAQEKGLEALKAGVACSDADAAARDIIAAAGYGEFFTHGLGHGVGMEIHEEPTLSPKSDKILETGDVVTVEPGIYLPGRFGIRVEDMAIITENGSENLTKLPKDPIII